MKICNTCNKNKPLNDFHKKLGKYRHGVTGSCKECTLSAQKEYRDTHIIRCKERRKNTRSKLLLEIQELKNKPCMDCGGIFPPYVMDFDHRDPKQKIGTISRFRMCNYSREKIFAEIAKCDLVCSNCHRIRTFREKHDGKEIRKTLESPGRKGKHKGETDKLRNSNKFAM